MFQFPASPSVGQEFSPTPGILFRWNGTAWFLAGSSTALTEAQANALYLKLIGGTLTGPVAVPAGATGAQAPQRQEVDAAIAAAGGGFVLKAGDTMTGPLVVPSVVTPSVDSGGGGVPLVLSTPPGGAQVRFSPGGSVKWGVSDSGVIFPAPDNVYDIGIAGTNRVRNIYFGGLVVGAQFDVPAPFNHLFSQGVNDALRIIHNAAPLGVSLSSVDASGSIAFRPLFFNGDGITIQAEAAGVIQFSTSGGNTRWQITNAGHLVANTDNAVDIGAPGAVRPRIGYFGTSIIVPLLNLPHGAAPGVPVNGDVWTTSAGMFARINGVTVGPFSAGGGSNFTTPVTFTPDNALDVGAPAASRPHAGYFGTLLQAPVVQGGSNPGDVLTLKATSSATPGNVAINVANAQTILNLTSGGSIQSDFAATSERIIRWRNQGTGGVRQQVVHNAGVGGDAFWQLSPDSLGTTPWCFGMHGAGAQAFKWSAGGALGTGDRLTLQTDGTVIHTPSAATISPLRLPHQSAPAAPVNGDLWSTTAGFFGRVNGATVGPWGTGGGGGGPVTQTLTDAAAIGWDTAAGDVADLTLTASGHTLNAPTNLTAGKEYTLFVRQDATGNRTMNFNAIFKWALGVVPVLSTAPNAVDLFVFKNWNGTALYGSMLKGMA